jgi:hypothetical protein
MAVSLQFFWAFVKNFIVGPRPRHLWAGNGSELSLTGRTAPSRDNQMNETNRAVLYKRPWIVIRRVEEA